MSAQPSWLPAFVAGERVGLEACYREYFGVIDKAVGSVLSGADRDTVVHEVFYKLMTRADVRHSFAGTSLAGWLRTLARNHARDFARRRGREVADSDYVEENDEDVVPSPEGATAAKEIIQRVGQRLSTKLRPVFTARFIEQRTQREAARLLDMPRTTLVAHEERIRGHIHKVIMELETG